MDLLVLPYHVEWYSRRFFEAPSTYCLPEERIPLLWVLTFILSVPDSDSLYRALLVPLRGFHRFSEKLFSLGVRAWKSHRTHSINYSYRYLTSEFALLRSMVGWGMAYPRVGLNVICLIRSGKTSYWHNIALEKVSPRSKPDQECSVRDELSTPSLGFCFTSRFPFHRFTPIIRLSRKKCIHNS